MLRQARPEDAEAIAGVHTRTWQTAYAHVFPPERLSYLPLPERIEQWKRILAMPTPTYVVEADGEIAGFAGGGPSRDEDGEGVGELYAIYVEPSHWGSGVAQELGAAVDAFLRASGFSDATLWVLDDNPRARRFYEANGWTTDGAKRRGRHLGVETDEVRYRKQLTD